MQPSRFLSRDYIRKTQRGSNYNQPLISRTTLAKEFPHKKQESTMFVIVKDGSLFGASIQKKKKNIKVLSTTLNGLAIISFYKPFNESF